MYGSGLRRLLSRLLPGAALAASPILGGCLGSSDDEAGAKGPLTYDRSRPLQPKVDDLGRRDAADVERVTFSGFDGQRVPGLFAKPVAADAPYPCLIYQGGLGSRKEDASFIWGGLATNGVATFTIDARDQGARADVPGRLRRDLRDPRRMAALIRGTTLDLRRAVDYLNTQSECDLDRIGFVGVSEGALTGSILAGSDRRVRATVLMAAAGDWERVLRRSDVLLPGIERRPPAFRRALRILAPYDPERWVGRIAPRPVMFVNGRKDRVTPPAAARKLQRAAREPKEILFYDGGHDPFARRSVDVVVRRVGDFLQRELVDASAEPG